MFILSNLLVAVARIVDTILVILSWLIIARALISWVNPDPFNPIVQFLYKTTEPILAPVKRLLPFILNFGIDISPIIALIAIQFLRSFLVKTLVDISLHII